MKYILIESSLWWDALVLGFILDLNCFFHSNNLSDLKFLLFQLFNLKTSILHIYSFWIIYLLIKLGGSVLQQTTCLTQEQYFWANMWLFLQLKWSLTRTTLQIHKQGSRVMCFNKNLVRLCFNISGKTVGPATAQVWYQEWKLLNGPKTPRREVLKHHQKSRLYEKQTPKWE